MDYLLFLQGLREAVPESINKLILFGSEMMGGIVAIVLMALVYWCLEKKAGTFMLMNFSSAYMVNQTVKNIFRVSRPFVKDSRIHPYAEAEGYSFSSGHTMLGTSVYGSVMVRQRKHKSVIAICSVMILFTAFGRNWAGVHTLQDVLVGIAAAFAVIGLNVFLQKQIDKHPNMDWCVLAAAILISFAMLFLISGSETVVGIFAGFWCGWFIERRFIKFEIHGSVLRRVVIFICGMVVLFALYKFLLPFVFSSLSQSTSKGLSYFAIFLFIMSGWPAVINLADKMFHQSGKNDVRQ